jgi:polar amino acid transport system substrate-binding protein
MPWVRAYSIAKNTPNTLILSMIKTPERDQLFDWIIKVSDLSRVFISLASKPENYVDELQQVRQKLTAVVLGSASYNELISQGFSENKNLYIVTDAQVMVKLLVNGRIDLVYEDPVNIQNILNNHGQTDLAICYKAIATENQRSSYIAMNKASNPQIVSRLKQAARKFETTDEYAKLLIE